MIGCVSRAFEPQRRITSVSSISRYDEVPPPAPNTVARPTTLGACQVRLHESMLFVPTTWRASFCASKFISFVAFEQEKIPNDVEDVARARANPAATASSASSQDAGLSASPSRRSGVVSRPLGFGMGVLSTRAGADIVASGAGGSQTEHVDTSIDQIYHPGVVLQQIGRASCRERVGV